MKILYFIGVAKFSNTVVKRFSLRSTASLPTYNISEGCEFLDETGYIYDKPFMDTELGDY